MGVWNVGTKKENLRKMGHAKGVEAEIEVSRGLGTHRDWVNLEKNRLEWNPWSFL
jgi:hypothetical protein